MKREFTIGPAFAVFVVGILTLRADEPIGLLAD